MTQARTTSLVYSRLRDHHNQNHPLTAYHSLSHAAYQETTTSKDGFSHTGLELLFNSPHHHHDHYHHELSSLRSSHSSMERDRQEGEHAGKQAGHLSINQSVSLVPHHQPPAQPNLITAHSENKQLNPRTGFFLIEPRETYIQTALS